MNEKIDVKSFIIKNVTPYDGDEKFLCGPSQKTKLLWDECHELQKKELEKGGVLDVDVNTISQIDSHKAGYINKDLEIIFGLQTDAPLKRSVKPFGGFRVAKAACEQAGYTISPEIEKICEYRKTHNDGVFSAYTKTNRKLRTTGIITGLPDNYARGRIIGDYRRVALYGIDKLIEAKLEDLDNLQGEMDNSLIRLREEVHDQIIALELMKKMAAEYGFDISVPAKDAKEAVQWTYFAYLAALKEHDGAAMSLGNVSNFFDIYIEKDIKDGKLTEEEAQELLDQFVIKLRLVRHLRSDDYNKLFAGDPTWLTEAIGGMFNDGRHKITKTSYRFIQTLYNLGPSPEPNITILWSKDLPENFKKFTTKVSVDTSSIQYENDDLMRETFNCDDYGISCCVSHLSTGKEMQYFGARCNLAKALLLALNGGYDEVKHIHVFDDIEKMKSDDCLDYDEVIANLKLTISDLAKSYINTMNIIHHMHDKYYYERAQMALLDTDLKRNMAFGIAGLSVVADSLSAIKYAKVKAIRNEEGTTVDFEIEGDFPKYGNDDDRVDEIAKWLVKTFDDELKTHHIYRNSTPTLSILTITSNVVYGKKTGATPDGRKAGVAFAPGANPMHGRDSKGAIASLRSVSKIPYESAKDGISNTMTITPNTLGANEEEQVENLISLLDGYFTNNAHHLNVNVINKDLLLDAMENPTKYPQLTIRVSGYAVNFVKLTREQQEEVLSRTFFTKMSA